MSRLRVGLVIADPAGGEPWELTLLKRLCDDDRLGLAVLVVDARRPAASPPFPYSLARRIDRAIFARPPAMDGYDALAAGIPRLSLDEGAGLGERLRELGIDVLVETVDDPRVAALRAAVPLGGWTFDFCLAAAASADVTGFWEAYLKAPLTDAAVVRRGGAAGEVRTVATMAVNTKFSGARNATCMMVRAVALMVRELRAAARGASAPDLGVHSPGPPRRPSFAATIGYGLHVAGSLAARAGMEGLTRLGLRADMWAIHVGQDGAPFIDPKRTRRLDPFRGQLWADPFLWREDDGLYLFFENYDYGRRLGRISVGRLDGDEFRFLGDALDLEHHLSYPFVFRHEGELYMMPERHQADRVEIWRCVEFPLRWELHSTALEGRSPADSVLHFDGAAWWLFTNLTSDPFPDHCVELHVFQVDGPDLKSVVPHAANPVVIGSETARNGGRIFARDGRLYRPAQRNSHGAYGYGLNVMEITELSPENYAEERVHEVSPDFAPALRGCHHLDAGDGVFVIDVCYRLGGFGRPAADVIRLS